MNIDELTRLGMRELSSKCGTTPICAGGGSPCGGAAGCMKPGGGFDMSGSTPGGRPSPGTANPGGGSPAAVSTLVPPVSHRLLLPVLRGQFQFPQVVSGKL